MNKTWIKEHWLEILLCVGIVIQIGALAVFNLTRLPYESNYDSSCAYAQIVETEAYPFKRLGISDHFGY